MADSYLCAAAKDLPLDKDSAWDGPAAAASVFAACGWPDDPQPKKAARAFLCYDSAAGDLKQSYKLPFASYKGDTLTAYSSGIRAAASRLPQTDGLSDAVKAAARAVIDHYEDKANPDPGSEPDADDKGRSSLVFALPAPITRLYASSDQPAGSVSEPWMDAAKKMAGDPSIFDTNPPYFFRAHISNNRADSYSTRMHSSTLQNYAADATAGVSFQNSHRDTELGFGRSIAGHYLGSAGNGSERTEADFYTVPGLNLNGVSTDDLIAGMRAGLVKDVSVGFYGGYMRCATCDRRLFSGSCRHVPGLTYDRDGKPTDDPEAKPSIAWIHDARLAEVSAVYDGACPGAAIMKARQLSEAGHLQPEQARLLEARYRIHLPASHRAFAGADLTPHKEEPMPELTLDDVRRDLRRLLEMQDPSIDPVAHVLEMAPQIREVTTLRAERDRLLPLEDELKRLTPLADMGRQYHVDLLEATLAEGVRAQGNGFPLETQRALLANATLDQLKTLKAAYEAQATTVLAGGRVSADKGEADPNPEAAPKKNDWTPKGAYAG